MVNFSAIVCVEFPQVQYIDLSEISCHHCDY